MEDRKTANRALIYQVTDPQPGDMRLLVVPCHTADDGTVVAYHANGESSTYKSEDEALDLILKSAARLTMRAGIARAVSRDEAAALRADIMPLMISESLSLRAKENLIPLEDGLVGISLVMGYNRVMSAIDAYGGLEDGDLAEKDPAATEALKEFSAMVVELVVRCCANGVFTHWPMSDGGDMDGLQPIGVS